MSANTDRLRGGDKMLNLGTETEQVEHKKSTSELKEGVRSIATMLNKHRHGVLVVSMRK